MRLNHQVIQHNMEIDAQKEHMKSREQDLKLVIDLFLVKVSEKS